MSSDPHPTTSSFLKSSVGSISTDPHLHPDNPYPNSPWIRRLRPNPSPLSPPQSTPIRDHSHSTIDPISTYESRTPLKLPQAQSDQQELSGEVISGFGPYQFKATSRVISKHFPLVARISRFGSDKRIADSRSKAFKLSPFFQFMPPLPDAEPRFTEQNFSMWLFPDKEEYLARVEFREGVSETSPNVAVQMPESPNLTNQEDEPFSYWNLGRINRNKTISSFASVPSQEDLPRKRSKGWSHI